MSPALPTVRARDVLKALQRAGFYIDHQTGSHARLFHNTRQELRVTIPIHNKDDPVLQRFGVAIVILMNLSADIERELEQGIPVDPEGMS